MKGSSLLLVVVFMAAAYADLEPPEEATSEVFLFYFDL
jgi:hypothetical protein